MERPTLEFTVFDIIDNIETIRATDDKARAPYISEMPHMLNSDLNSIISGVFRAKQSNELDSKSLGIMELIKSNTELLGNCVMQLVMFYKSSEKSIIQKYIWQNYMSSFVNGIESMLSVWPFKEFIGRTDLSESCNYALDSMDTHFGLFLRAANYVFNPKKQMNYLELDMDLRNFVMWPQIYNKKMKVNTGSLKKLRTNQDYFTHVIEPLIKNAAVHALSHENDIYGRALKNLEIMIKNRVDEDSKEYIIQFIDDGYGIKHEYLPLLFSGFSSRSEKGNVHGQGLRNVKASLDSHGGKISVESELGKRTMFEIRIPYDKIEKGLYIKE